MPDSSESRSSGAGSTRAPLWLVLDIAQDADGWSTVADAEQLIASAGAALAAHPRFANSKASEACVALSDDAAVRELNRRYRGKDKPTNVLSFPAPNGAFAPQSGPTPLGDVVIALETVEREARAQQVPFPHHLLHLAVHGLLHLLGFDHETESDAKVMEGLEVEILSRLGIANPYLETVIATET